MNVKVGTETYTDVRSVDEAIEKARNDPKNTKVYDPIEKVKERITAAGGSGVGYRSDEDLRNMDAQIKAAQKQQTQMTEAKHSLMSEQLTGKTRQELIDLSESGDIEGLIDKARQVEDAKPSTLAEIRAERDRLALVREREMQAVEAQKFAEEAKAADIYNPKNLTKEMRDRLTTWADDPNNPTVGWADMASKLNINPQAVIEAKRQLKETISKIPGAGQTVEGILSGEIWNNPIVTNVIQQMVDSPQGRRWEGDVGVVYRYLAGREPSTGQQQADTSMSTFRSEGHGVTGGPGRHPTQAYDDFDEYQMALKSGMSPAQASQALGLTGGATIEAPPTPSEAGHWNVERTQPDTSWAQRKSRDFDPIQPFADPWSSAALGGISTGDPASTLMNPARSPSIPEAPSTPFNTSTGGGGGGDSGLGSSILEASNPASVMRSLPQLPAAPTRRISSAPDPQGTITSQVMDPVQQATGQGASMPQHYTDDIFGHSDILEDPASGWSNVPTTNFLQQFGAEPREWQSAYQSILNAMLPQNPMARRGLENFYQPLQTQYLLGSLLPPSTMGGQGMPGMVSGLAGDTFADYVRRMVPGGSGGAAPWSARGGQYGGFNLMNAEQMKPFMSKAAQILQRNPSSNTFTGEETALREFLMDPNYGMGRQMDIAGGLSSANVQGWLQPELRRGAENLLLGRAASGGLAESSPLAAFVNRGFKF